MDGCIVVADDDPNIRRLIVKSLQRRGYRMIEAANGKQALAAMAGGDPSLAVLDLRMPEMSGWDVLEERRQNPVLRRIPVIVVSGDVDDAALKEALSKGECVLLSKPFDVDELVEMVARHFPGSIEESDGQPERTTGEARFVVVEESSSLVVAAGAGRAKSMGIEIEQAATSEDAIRLLRGSRITAVLVDEDTVGESLGAVLSAVRPLRPRPIVFVAASRKNVDLPDSDVITLVIAKPYDAELLLAIATHSGFALIEREPPDRRLPEA